MDLVEKGCFSFSSFKIALFRYLKAAKFVLFASNASRVVINTANY